MTERILIFDSGLGGLTVYREIVTARPAAEYIYVADDEFFPYGGHSEADLIARVVPLMGRLIGEHRPNLIVVACNTASTLVLEHLRAAYDAPFVGTVPAIKPACAASVSKSVTMLGTKATVSREYTHALIRDYAQGCDVTLIGSARLAPIAEDRLGGIEPSDADIASEIAPCFVDREGQRTDTIVLACTHFPLLLDRLIALAPWPVSWVDPAPAIARRVAGLLGPVSGSPGQGSAQFYFTSGQQPAATLAKRLADFDFAAKAANNYRNRNPASGKSGPADPSSV